MTHTGQTGHIHRGTLTIRKRECSITGWDIGTYCDEDHFQRNFLV